ncbi:MAG: response regulator transcription factor [Gammaproteobacteria bacterium]
MTAKLKLLLVEDEEAIARGLTDVFIYHGYAVDVARDGDTGLRKALDRAYDLVILDVMLPQRDGYSICNEIRQRDREQPIIMLTAKTGDDDIIAGLTLGADDYIGKPFSVRELVLRVEAVLRRSRKLREMQWRLMVGAGIEIDMRNLLGIQGGREIAFTRTELELLDFLQRNSDRPISRKELLTEVWGYRKGADIETRTVDIHIAKLRKKIEPDPKQPRYLVTVRNEGYRLLGDGGR